MNKIEKLNVYFESLKGYKLILILWLLSYVVTFPVVIIQKLLNQSPLWKTYNVTDINIMTLLVVSIFILPFVETFIFQSLIFKICEKMTYFADNKIRIVLASAIVFALAHKYSYLHMLSGLIIGMILAYGYYIFEKREGAPFLMVSFIHCLRNAVSVGMYILGIM